MFKGRFMLPVLMVVLFAPSEQVKAQAGNVLKLDQAYALVLSQNPQVQSYRAKVIAVEGHRVQQSLRPNPEAVFEVDNFGGDSQRNGLDATEYTLGIEQQVEVAGKRSKRERVASIEKQRISQEALAAIQAMLAQTKATYMRVAIAQERLALTKKRETMADRTHETVKARIRVAKAADIQHTKADIQVSAAKVETRKAYKELSMAKTSLANLMGLVALDQSIKADLAVFPEVPEREVILRTLEATPMSVISHLSVMRQGAVLDLARANGVSDPIFGLGVRRFSEDDGTALVASISLPITVFDRNQGAIAEAKANLLAAQADQEARRLSLERQAMDLWQTLVSAHEQVLVYQGELLPSATKAYAQAEDGFSRGAFSLLDLLDAQRTLFDIQEAHLESLSTFYKTKAQTDLLTGEYAVVAASVFNLNIIERE